MLTIMKGVDILLILCNNLLVGNVTGNNTGNVAGNNTEKIQLFFENDMALKKRSVTIQDVAKTAGVSVSTVSRVLNNKVDVSQKTKDHIVKVIDELGYTSNLAARSMRSHKTNLLGLVVPDIGYPYSSEIMKGVDRAISETDFDLLVYTTGGFWKTGTVSREQHYVSLLNNSLTDGVIVSASSASEFNTNGPIVVVDPHVVRPEYPAVRGKNYKGSLSAVRYLIELGHERIAFISGRPEIGSAGYRLKGYLDGLKEADLEIIDELIKPGDFSTRTGYQCAMELMQMDNPPTAIFAANDQSALGVYQAARELDMSIPNDFSLIGFDNITEARYLGLTTIDQSLNEMGYIATQMLMKLVNNEPLEKHVHKLPTRLIVRESCRALEKK